MSAATLQSLIDDGLLRPVTDPNRPEWIAPGNEPEPRPRDGYIVSFMAFHEHGLGLSADQFMRALPHYYGVELHNFNPNSIAQAAIFVAVCEGYLCIAPTGSCGSTSFGRSSPPSRRARRASGSC